MIGASGSYAINGTDFTLQPTSGRWMPQSSLGYTGDGHPIFSAVHEFQIRWQLTEQVDLDQVQTWRDSIGITGSVAIDLPVYRGPAYIFQTYSGCVLSEPERGEYFSENTTEFMLTVGNIRP